MAISKKDYLNKGWLDQGSITDDVISSAHTGDADQYTRLNLDQALTGQENPPSDTYKNYEATINSEYVNSMLKKNNPDTTSTKDVITTTDPNVSPASVNNGAPDSNITNNTDSNALQLANMSDYYAEKSRRKTLNEQISEEAPTTQLSIASSQDTANKEKPSAGKTISDAEDRSTVPAAGKQQKIALYNEAALANASTEFTNIIKQRLGKVAGVQRPDIYKEAILLNYNKHKKIINPSLYNGYRRMHVFLTMPSMYLFQPAITETYTVRPDLSEKDAVLDQFLKENIWLGRYLDKNSWVNVGKTIFMFPMMNLLKGFSGLPNFEMKLRDTSANMRNNFNQIAVDTLSENSNHNVTLTFEDDRNCTIAKLMYMYLRYMDGVNLGIFPPSNDAAKRCMLDYTCSMYVFITDETNSDIAYWFKYTGMFPKLKTYDFLNTSSMIIKERGDISIPFKVSAIEDMNPYSLAEFNYLNAKYLGDGNSMSTNLEATDKIIKDKAKWRPTYNRSLGDYYVNRFYITTEKDTALDKTKHKLLMWQSGGVSRNAIGEILRDGDYDTSLASEGDTGKLKTLTDNLVYYK